MLSDSVEIIIERFEMKRICLALREKGWFFTSGYGKKESIQLRFIRQTEKETRKLLASSSITDILKGLYGDI